MGTNFQLIARRLVDVRRAQNVVALDLGRQRNRALDHRARALGRVHDLLRRLIDQLVIERLEANSDTLVLHFDPRKNAPSARRSVLRSLHPTKSAWPPK